MAISPASARRRARWRSSSRVSRLEFYEERIDLTELARETADRLADAEPDRKVSIAVEEGLEARGDRRLLRVLLENLLSNALKFTRESDSPRIAAAHRIVRRHGGRIWAEAQPGRGAVFRFSLGSISGGADGEPARKALAA